MIKSLFSTHKTQWQKQKPSCLSLTESLPNFQANGNISYALKNLILISFTEVMIFRLIFIVQLACFTKYIKFLEGSILACLFSLYILTYG